MKNRHMVFLLAATIAACGPDRSTPDQTQDDPQPPSSDLRTETSNSSDELHVDGDLADGDYILPTGSVGDRYELIVEPGEVIEIVLQSSTFDTYLQAVTPSGETRVNDDHPGAQNQSRLTLFVREAGKLKITVTSYAPGGRGRYRLDATRSQGQPEVVAAASGHENRPNWTSDLLPNALRIASDLLSSRPHHRVELPPPPPGQPPQQPLPGQPIAPGQPGQPNQVPGQPGQPTMPGQPLPSAPGQPGQPGQRTPAPTPGLGMPIQLGGQVNGRLEAGDITLATGEYRDIYFFQAQPGTSVNIELQSSNFDPYVILVSPSGQQWENDDANGALNSQLIMALPEPGTYRIVATSLRPGETGDYLLKVRTPNTGGAAPSVVPGTQQQPPGPSIGSFSGTLAQGDSQLSSGEFVDRHQVTLQAGQPVQIRLSSSQFDTYLIIRAPSGRQWDNDDFEQGSYNSGLDFVPPESGQYTIAVTSYRPGESGSYTLAVTSMTGAPVPSMPSPGVPQPGQLPPGTQPPAQPGQVMPGTPGANTNMPGAVGLGQPIQGSLGQGDTQLGSGEFRDAFPMQLQAGQRVSFRVESTQFDTYLIVRAPSGRQWDNDDMQPGVLNSGLDLTLTETGAYRIIVTSYRPGEVGAYTLRMTPAGAGSSPGMPTLPGYPGQPGQPPGQPGQVTPPGQPGQVTPPGLPPGGIRPQPGGGRVFGIYVGITAYPSGRLPLCADDAIKLAEDMRRANLQSQAQQIVLTDQDATPARVRQAFAQMGQMVGPNDLFIFFYSGHGSQSGEQTAGQEELDRREESLNLIGGDITDNDMAQLFNQINARVAIIALDSCFSGGFSRDVISRPNRMGFFSSEEDLTSSVASNFQAGGYLSHFLRLGLRGEADNNPRDALLTAGELTHYLYTMYGQHMQDVTATTVDQQQSHQHLVIDRGSIRVSTPLVSYR